MELKENEEALIIGAGAAPWTYLERNAEVFSSPGTHTKFIHRWLWKSISYYYTIYFICSYGSSYRVI